MSANQASFPVAVMARVLGVSKAGFYAWLRRRLRRMPTPIPRCYSACGRCMLSPDGPMERRVCTLCCGPTANATVANGLPA